MTDKALVIIKVDSDNVMDIMQVGAMIAAQKELHPDITTRYHFILTNKHTDIHILGKEQQAELLHSLVESLEDSLYAHLRESLIIIRGRWRLSVKDLHTQIDESAGFLLQRLARFGSGE